MVLQAHSAYPYVDPSYGGIYAAYIGQPVVWYKLYLQETSWMMPSFWHLL